MHTLVAFLWFFFFFFPLIIKSCFLITEEAIILAVGRHRSPPCLSLLGTGSSRRLTRRQLCLAWAEMCCWGGGFWQHQTRFSLLLWCPLLSTHSYRCSSFFYATCQVESSSFHLAEGSSSSLALLSVGFWDSIHMWCWHRHGCLSSCFNPCHFAGGDVRIPQQWMTYFSAYLLRWE